jgi:outer membrane murein-binding lipoprotein Lpp
MATMTDSDAAIEPVLRLLARVRREARLWVWVESLAILALAAAAIVWGTLALDWLIEPPAWARGTALAAAAAVVAWLVATRLVARLAAPLSDRSLALAVERRLPQYGDTLSTAVTLLEGEGDPVDPELARRTTSVAARLAERAESRAIFRRGRLVAVAVAGLAAAASVGGLMALRPTVAALWARRVLLLEEVPWPRRVHLAAEGFTSGVRKVARGSDLDLLVRVTADGPLPAVVELRSRVPEGSWQTVRMGTRGAGDTDGRTFGHVLPALGEDLELEIRGGDARLRGLLLDVVEPPRLATATIRCTLPDYLGGGRREPPASRVVPVPRGSKVDVTLEATKPLAEATLWARFADDEHVDDESATKPAAHATAAGRLLASRSADDPPGTTLSAVIEALDADCTLLASFTDADGITNREPITLVLAAVPDEPPRVAVRLAGISTAVTPAATLPIVGTLADDHGLAGAAVTLAKGGEPLTVPIPRIRGGEPLVEIPAERPELVPLAPLEPAVGDRLTVAVTARDGCTLTGGPNLASSETFSLEVVTPEALQAMLEAREVLLRRRFEAAIEDLARARRRLDDPGEDGTQRAVGGLAEAATRAGGEAGEIAAAFRGIRDELANNALLTPELETRLVIQIAEPLAAAVAGPLATLAEACRADDAGEPLPADLEPPADAAIAALEAVLGRMLELESFNEVLEQLRGVIEAQERIRRDTLKRQRQRARELLE